MVVQTRGAQRRASKRAFSLHPGLHGGKATLVAHSTMYHAAACNGFRNVAPVRLCLAPVSPT